MCVCVYTLKMYDYRDIILLANWFGFEPALAHPKCPQKRVTKKKSDSCLLWS